MLRNFLITFVGGFAANMCVSDKIPLNPPLRKGEVVWRCLYVLSLYSASPQRAAVSNKHVAQFSHHICWGLRGKHVRVRQNPPSIPLYERGRWFGAVCKCCVLPADPLRVRKLL